MHLSCARNGAMLIWHNAGLTDLTLFNTWSIPAAIVPEDASSQGVSYSNAL
jgi:hypothetical protein